MERWDCTNHGAQNVVKHSRRIGQGELYRCCARAGNKSKWGYFYHKLTDGVQDYLDNRRGVSLEQWSVAHNKELEAGGLYPVAPLQLPCS